MAKQADSKKDPRPNHVESHEGPQPSQRTAPNPPDKARDRKILLLRAEVERLERENYDLREKVLSSERLISDLKGSTSWRLTRPVRFLSDLVKPSRMRAHLARFGGIRKLAALIRSVRGGGFSAAAGTATSLPRAGIARTSQGNYALVSTTPPYTYVEPRPPSDLEATLLSLNPATIFAIVVPVYNTPTPLLEALVNSVVRQWYPHWQLLLVDDASPSPETQAALNGISHPKIQVIRLPNNRGISGATNAGIQAAFPKQKILDDHLEGDRPHKEVAEFIVFLDHDDELTVDCLYELALCIHNHQPDFIYSDEDKLTESGQFADPHFKPDWSPDTMMTTMFTCHVSCVRRSIVDRIGGLRSEFDGCQDWDFVLRLSEHTNRIFHIPKVLYHWRAISGSIATQIDAKPQVVERTKAIRQEALARRNLEGVLEPVVQAPGYFRVAYEIQGNPLISIVIPTRDNHKILDHCINSILQRTEYDNYQIIVLDNGSVDADTLSALENLKQNDRIAVIRHDAPFNFSELNNIGAQASEGQLLLFLNDDTEVIQSDWLSRLAGFAQLSHVGAVSAKLLYPGNVKIQHAGVINLEAGPGHALLGADRDAPGYFMRNLLEFDWLAVTGACLMIQKDKFIAVGGFSEELPIAYNDIDLCMRLVRQGLYNVVVPAVCLIHHESASRGVDHLDPEKQRRLILDRRKLYERNPQFYQTDPFHNPNLHPNGIHFEVPTYF